MALPKQLNSERPSSRKWVWHEAEWRSVRASLLVSGERRLEAGGFLGPGYLARYEIRARGSGWKYLGDLASVWQPSRLKGIQVGRDFGNPFLAASQIFHSRPRPRKWLSLHRTTDHAARLVDRTTVLLSRSGSVGRATMADATIAGVLVSDDLLRVVPRSNGSWGWIYAYLRAPTVRSMMQSAQYGHIIKHLETHHLEALPVVQVGPEQHEFFERCCREMLELRERAEHLVDEAETIYGEAVGRVTPRELVGIGFTTRASEITQRGRRLEGSYYNPLARAAEEAVRSSTTRIEALGDLVEGAYVPGRFKHVYGDRGVPYLDSAQILEATPEITKRVLSLNEAQRADYLVRAGTLLVPCSGQLHGIIGTAVVATSWHQGKVLSNHILRIVPAPEPRVRTGYLQAVLNHPFLGRPRVIRSTFGSSVPELGPGDLARLTVPRLTTSTEHEIADRMEQAARCRAQAAQLDERMSSNAEDLVNRFLAEDGEVCSRT